ncbi:MAG: extradiol ring-cleavage dioxygenase [Acidobacteria bacterium]|nr:MAG: extradiol ring-cleavage dioxygenase [Acidobacteriota bacterium]PYS19218.1 MAG: extradiol ring-cleavage dioxygenase [Acidobacteriota bacterium]
MGEILGLGMTHYPPLAGQDENMSGILRGTLRDPVIPAYLKDPDNWPRQMQEEWGTDQGKTKAAEHRQALLNSLQKIRIAIDEFKPDFVVIWGDDQYENFTEDIIPPFCILAYDTIEAMPWRLKAPGMPGAANVWSEREDFVFTIQGHREGGKRLAAGLISEGFDVCYSYRPLHLQGVGHAFLNSVAYLDYYRKGFQHPVVCFSVNCYGRRVISFRGGAAKFGQTPPAEQLDPPSPSPSRCFDLGKATARVLKNSPYRVALIASSSWSHAFLHDKAWRLYPDIESDRALYAALCDGRHTYWRNMPLSAIENSGQQEMLNWFCLAGAMAELDRTPAWSEFIESYVFNSNKCFAIYPTA